MKQFTQNFYGDGADFFKKDSITIKEINGLDRERSAVEVIFECKPNQMLISMLDMIGELEDAQGQEWLEETRTKIQVIIDKLENIVKTMEKD